MPLPDGGNEPWPPRELTPVTRRLAVWSAWYSGDLDALASVYGGQLANDTTGFFATERGGFRGRVSRTLQRWFHGGITPGTEQRTKLHIPIAADMAAASADLLFSEPPSLTVEDTTTQDWLNEVVDDGLDTTLLEAADVQAGLGGVYLRTVWDRDFKPRPWLTPVHADSAVPEWQWGHLKAVTFWKILHDNGTDVVRHLERHERGAIMHGVYEGDMDTLGRRVPLTAYPQTAGIAEVLTDGDTIATGLDKNMTATYVPNMRPNRLWRNVPCAAHLGRSDYAAIEPLMDALDEVWSSWMRDIRLAKGRLLVPDAYLQSNGPGQGARFNAEQEIFTTLNAMPQVGGPMTITPNQFAIRVQEHRDTAHELMESILRTGGYSAQTFGLDGEQKAITATEVDSRTQRSLITRDRKSRYWRPALAEATETLMLIGVKMCGAKITPQRADVDFAPAVSVDPEAQARTLQLLQQAEAISTQLKVEMQHPDWDKTQVQEEVDRIKADTGRSVTNPDTFTGSVGGAGSKPVPDDQGADLTAQPPDGPPQE